MTRLFCLAAACYGVLISIAAVYLAVLDKRRARRGGRRVPERTLLLAGFLGGALPMYAVMRLIHHKTRHKKFMVGLPLEFLFHFALLLLILARSISLQVKSGEPGMAGRNRICFPPCRRRARSGSHTDRNASPGRNCFRAFFASLPPVGRFHCI